MIGLEACSMGSGPKHVFRRVADVVHSPCEEPEIIKFEDIVEPFIS